MAGTGSAPGERRGGRKPGTPNKVTTGFREVMLAFVQKKAPEVEEAWDSLLVTDPSKALDFYAKCASLCMPREVTGGGGEPIVFRLEESPAALHRDYVKRVDFPVCGQCGELSGQCVCARGPTK